MDRQTLLMQYIQKELIKGRSASFSPDDDLLSSSVLDSLGILQLVAFINEKLGVQVADEDVVIENFQSVTAILDYLGSKEIA